MGKINNISPFFQNASTLSDLRRFASAAMSAILDQINGKLVFHDNIMATGPIQIALAANEPTRVFHDLAQVPNGYLVIWKSAAANVIRPQASQFEWTAQQIFIQADSDVTIGLLII